MMPEPSRFDIAAKDENLDRLVAWIEDFCQKYTSAEPFEMHMQLSAEELFLNEVNHVDSQQRKTDLLRFALWPQPEGVVLVMETDGPPFDPFSDAPEPDVDASVEDRAIGGLGLKLVRETATKSAYCRVNGCNRISLVFGHGNIP